MASHTWHIGLGSGRASVRSGVRALLAALVLGAAGCNALDDLIDVEAPDRIVGDILETPDNALVLMAGEGETNKWGVSLYYYATMFFIASVCWLFIEPRQVIVYAPEDLRRLREQGVLE